MKSLLLFPILLASCAAPPSGGPGPSPASSSEHDIMERKLVGFQEKFDRFDHDGNGYLTPSEVSTGLVTEQIEGITPADVPKIFAYYDTNRDGRISLHETNAAHEAGPAAALRAQRAPLP